jgi:serine phosphatase RsbU (regulator of sigma subunit)
MSLGLFTHTTFEATVLALQIGDAVLVVTKGVTGSRRGGTEFGVQRVTRTLRNMTAASASAICEAVLHEAHGFAHHPWSRFLSIFHTKNGCNEDDLTALALVRS